MKEVSKDYKLFENKFLEKHSRTNAFIVIFSFVIVSICLFLNGLYNAKASYLIAILLYFFGVFIFTLAEYLIHRFVFHSGQYFQKGTWQFKIHGIHHVFPQAKDRLAMPLPLAMVLAAVVFWFCWIVIGWYAFYFFPGFIIGYSYYLFVHYIIHTRRQPHNFLRILWKQHFIHHYKNDHVAFGVTSPFWDVVFQTMPMKKNDDNVNKVRSG